MCIAVSSGNCSLYLSLKNPVKLAHFKYLTLPNCVFRLHVPAGNLTGSFETLAEYIVKVYIDHNVLEVFCAPLYTDFGSDLYKKFQGIYV